MAGVTQPKVSRVAPPQLVDWARDGRIRIPPFQRPYRWDASDAERLFDSILRGYPIGNLLMWRKPAPAAEVSIGETTFDAPEQPAALWVVDGQQRLTTLVGALTGSEETVDRRFRIFYDLREEKFLSSPHSHRPREHWLPVWVAADNRRLLAWQRARPWLSDHEFELCDAVTTAIRTYEIPMYEIEGDDEKALREIFDRMNTFGKALKRAEIFQALHSAPLDVQPSDLDTLRVRAAGFRFGDFSQQVLMQSVMAVRGGKVDRDFRQEFRDDADRQDAFARTEKALRVVVDFLRTEAGIPHLRLLPYALFTPVLTRFVALFGRPDERSAELLRRWIWRGAVVGAAPQGNTVALRRNATAVADDPVASAGRLLALLPPGGENWRPDLTQAALNRAQGRINVLGLLSARPVLLTDLDQADGDHYPRGTRVDQPELLQTMLDGHERPLREIMPGGGRGLANRIAHPVVAESIGSLLLGGGNESGADESGAASHCVDDTALSLLARGDHERFLKRREIALTQLISGHVQRMALWGFADGPEIEAWFDQPDDIWGDHDAA
ncbi:DUF262 domain-containing protein [Streptomyces otsuchiensis]|uniref:DUF262 domain-containing protein n=1 Tax=Streptomyces otsuchiensis TaxID=2681388 RepID=UPI00102F500F|nr:DUF262 domain-containing protein [Streptomyces otsuchiensis]